MKSIISKTLTAMALLSSSTLSLAGGPPSKPGEFKASYEMATVDVATGDVSAGAALNAPGDLYRYTFLIKDEYINNPDYKLQRAVLGIHITDPDYSETSGDRQQEWGSITLDGSPQVWIRTRSEYRKGETPELTDLVELSSDPETMFLPSYIFDVVDKVKDDGKVVIEVTNLREDGNIKGDANFGSFIVKKASAHMYYVKTSK